MRRQTLEEAAHLIDGDRNHTYGSPIENFTNTSKLWNVRFGHLFRDGCEFTASDVADAMILLKIARGIAHKTHDTYVDIAGYAGCGNECKLAEQKKSEPVPATEYTINVSAPPDANADDIATFIRTNYGKYRGRTYHTE